MVVGSPSESAVICKIVMKNYIKLAPYLYYRNQLYIIREFSNYRIPKLQNYQIILAGREVGKDYLNHDHEGLHIAINI